MLVSNKKFNEIPDSPGVYFFKKDREVLYVGKATSLRDRIKSYFGKDLTERRGAKILKMIQQSTSLSWKETDSVLEALILEAKLIKKYRPKSNTLGKDNKSYNHIVITKEDYPRVIMVREHDLKYNCKLGFEIKYQFGPFPHGGQLKEALKIVRRIFPFRGEKDRGLNDKKRTSSLNVELGLVPDFSFVSKKEYQKAVRNLKLFFEGKKNILKKKIEKEMLEKAKNHDFEEAETLKKQIFALDHIQDVAILKNKNSSSGKRIEAYDVAHMGEKNRVGVMVVVENGSLQPKDYRKFNIKRQSAGDVGALKEILKRRFSHKEWKFPDLVVVDGGKSQINIAKKELEKAGLLIQVVAVIKDEKHKAGSFLGEQILIEENQREIVLANAEAHRFAIKSHRKKRRKNYL